MPMLRKVAQKQNRTNFPSQTERKSAWDKSMNSSAGSSALNTNWFNFPVVWSSNRFTFSSDRRIPSSKIREWWRLG